MTVASWFPVQSAADTARDAAFLVDPEGSDPAVGLMVAVIAHLVAHPDDEDLDGRVLERAARGAWGDELPAAIAERVSRCGCDEPVDEGETVFATREQDEVFDALALEHDQVIVDRAPTRTQPRLFAAQCVNDGRVDVVYRVYPSGLRCLA